MSTMIRRSWYRSVMVLLLVGLVLLLLSGTQNRVSAQQNPDCEDPDTIACLPVSGAGQAAPAPAAAHAAAPAQGAAAAPAPIAVRPPCLPPPYPLPYANPAAAAAAPGQSAPIPLPPNCFNDLYGTINRANLAYARAMRSLDATPLYPFWGQDALHDLQGQIGTLRATSSYRVLRLVSIQVVEQNLYSGYAWVHTSEHWITSTWSNYGYQYDSNDAWYDNQYYLYAVGGRWLIGTDIVN